MLGKINRLNKWFYIDANGKTHWGTEEDMRMLKAYEEKELAKWKS